MKSIGVAPFTIDQSQFRIMAYKLPLTLTIIHAGLIIIFTPCAIFYVTICSAVDIVGSKNLTMPIVNIGTRVTSYMIISIQLIFQIWRRKTVADHLTKAIMIYEKFINIEGRTVHFSKAFYIRFCLIFLTLAFKLIVLFAYPFYIDFTKLDAQFVRMIASACVEYSDLISVMISGCYYILLLVINEYFGILNKILSNIVNEIRDSSSNCSKYQRIMKHCELSDKLDELSIIYNEIYGIMKSSNHIYEFPVLGVLGDCYVNLLSEVLTKI